METAAFAKKGFARFIVNIALTLFAIYLLYLFVGTCIKINQKKATISDQSIQISSKTTEKEQLKNTLEAEIDLEYIEKIAREKGGYVNPDEKVYETITD